MNDKNSMQMLSNFGSMDCMMKELLKGGTIQHLIELPEPLFNVAMERVRRAHLEQRGYRFQDPDNPATCESCEG